MKTRIFLVRHAQVENPKNLLYGHLPGFGLSSFGRIQARILGSRLASQALTKIVHSPLKRARETAELIAAQQPCSVPLVEDDRLTEAAFSRYLQGVPYWQIPFRRPLWMVHIIFRGWLSRDESVETMGGRLLEVLEELAQFHPGQSTAIVTHGDPIKAAWVLLDGGHQAELQMYWKRVGKAGVIEVQMEGAEVVGTTYHSPPSGSIEDVELS